MAMGTQALPVMNSKLHRLGVGGSRPTILPVQDGEAAVVLWPDPTLRRSECKRPAHKI